MAITCKSVTSQNLKLEPELKKSKSEPNIHCCQPRPLISKSRTEPVLCTSDSNLFYTLRNRKVYVEPGSDDDVFLTNGVNFYIDNDDQHPTKRTGHERKPGHRNSGKQTPTTTQKLKLNVEQKTVKKKITPTGIHTECAWKTTEVTYKPAIKKTRKHQIVHLLLVLVCILVLCSSNTATIIKTIYICKLFTLAVEFKITRARLTKRERKFIRNIHFNKLLHNGYDDEECPHIQMNKITLHLRKMHHLFNSFKPCTIDIIVAPGDGGSLESFFQSLINGSSVEDSMNFEWVRLRSFASFRCRADVSPIVLSRLGFYYTGTGSEVKCFSCGATYNEWCPGDNVLDVHRRISPECRHIAGSDQRNVPIGHRTVNSSHSLDTSCCVSSQGNQGTNPTQHLQTSDYARDQSASGESSITTVSSECRASTGLVSTSDGIERQTNVASPGRYRIPETTQNLTQNVAYPERQTYAASSSNSSSGSSTTINKLSPLGVNFEKPRYPQYAVLTVRISTFNGWPGSENQTPRKMAEAGFIYAGYADYTRCFFCGGGLRNWEEGDDPWIEHARWFPKCAYVRQNKGDQFVQLVHERLQEVLTETMDRTTRNMGKFNQFQASNDQETNQNTFSSAPSDFRSWPSFQSVLELGYASDLIESVVVQLLNQGKTSITSNEILEVIFKMEDSSVCTPSDTPTPGDITSQDDDINITEVLEENRRLREQRLCMVCVENDSCVTFLPCAHLVCCEDCAPAMRRCPKCQELVQGSIKTWLV